MITTESNNYKQFFEKIFLQCLEVLKQPENLEVGVELVSEEEICQINKSMRNVDKSTDVLSFPTICLKSGEKIKLSKYKNDIDQTNGQLYLGDIAICDKIALTQSLEYGHSLERELAYLFLHGLLHLFGFDHLEESDKALMRQKEEEILNKLQITREDNA